MKNMINKNQLFSMLLISMLSLGMVSNISAGDGSVSASATLDTSTIDIAVGASGSFTLSGNDGNNRQRFRWDIPAGLDLSEGAVSSINRFKIDTGKMELTIETNGNGSFSATVNVSSSTAGSFVLNNTRADINLSNADITVNVTDSSGGSGGGSGGGTGGGGSGGGTGGGGTVGGTGTGSNNPIPVLDASNVTLRVNQISRTMSDGKNVNFWVFCEGGMGGGGMGGGGGCTLPSPVLVLGVNQTANISLDMMMAPQERPPYHGHTIHNHGVDVPDAEDGVPETGATVLGDTYSYSVDSRYVGSHAYHCHVHTVKHLEMGMYGALIVKDGSGQINAGGPAYDYEWNWVLSTVDPAYHTATGDSTVFADYNPRYFLINGQEGLSTGSPAEIFDATAGTDVAIRLIGMHSVNSTFQVRDANGNRQSFIIHNKDGFALSNPQNVSSADVSPGQTMDIMITLPGSSGSWYPEVSYKDLRNSSTYNNGTVYTRIDF